MQPPILDPDTHCYGEEFRTLRWIYLLDPPTGLGYALATGPVAGLNVSSSDSGAEVPT